LSYHKASQYFAFEALLQISGCFFIEKDKTTDNGLIAGEMHDKQNILGTTP